MPDEPIEVPDVTPDTTDASDSSGGIESLFGIYDEGDEDWGPPDPKPEDPPESPDGPTENTDAANQPPVEVESEILKALKAKAGMGDAPDANAAPDLGSVQKDAFTKWALAQEPGLTTEQLETVYAAYQQDAGFENWLAQKSAPQQPPAQPAAPETTPIELDPDELDAALLEGGGAVKAVLEKGISATIDKFVGRYDAEARRREAGLYEQVMKDSAAQAQQIIGIAEMTVLSALAAKELPEIYEHQEIWSRAVQAAVQGSSSPKEIVDKAFAEFKKDLTTFKRMQAAPNRVDVRSAGVKTPPKMSVNTPSVPAVPTDDPNNLNFLAGILGGQRRD
jgi:hypothetical protein